MASVTIYTAVDTSDGTVLYSGDEMTAAQEAIREAVEGDMYNQIEIDVDEEGNVTMTYDSEFRIFETALYF